MASDQRIETSVVGLCDAELFPSPPLKSPSPFCEGASVGAHRGELPASAPLLALPLHDRSSQSRRNDQMRSLHAARLLHHRCRVL